MKRIALVGLLSALASATLFGQAVPVVGVDDPAKLFTDKDPTINKNKQAAMHIVIDLLECSHWDEAPKWLTERYIQHNPGFSSGRETVMKAFAGRGPAKPCPTDPKEWKTKIVSVSVDGDKVTVASRREVADPRNPGQTYTTTHFDMWRFVDGKADEHWDEGLINPPRPAPAAAPKQ
jgi:predicted SnoaL-like aldol condensation-catalyzing enzyme